MVLLLSVNKLVTVLVQSLRMSWAIHRVAFPTGCTTDLLVHIHHRLSVRPTVHHDPRQQYTRTALRSIDSLIQWVFL